MEQKELLELFFSQKKEYQEFKNLRKNPSSFDREGMITYIKNICAIPLGFFIDYISEHPSSRMIDTLDLTQSSKISNCKSRICEAINRANDRGLTLTEIGGLLHDDNKKRTNNTLNRFGRDQTLTARQLGLTKQHLDGKWYLSSIGKVYLDSDNSTQEKIIARCLLRDPLYHQLVVDSITKDIHILDYMTDLDSEETIKRRKSSIYNLVKIIIKQVEKDCPSKLNQILQN